MGGGGEGAEDEGDCPINRYRTDVPLECWNTIFLIL